MALKDNEDVYDEQIAPLMTQIIAVCKKHKIPMVASFEYAPNDFCTTVIPQKGQAEVLSKAAKMLGPQTAPFMAFTITTGEKAAAK